MNESVSLTAAFVTGLLGGAHCIGMCGGIMNALSFAIPAEQRSGLKLNLILLSYNVGRIFSYVLAGIILGAVVWWFKDAFGLVSSVLRSLAGVLLIAMGLYLAGWWFGLRYLEQAGGHVWRYIEPLGKRLMPVTHPGQALILGAVWGWVPCGMVYTVLTWSAASGDWMTAGLVMLSFGLGTLPVMFVTGRLAHVLKTFIQKTAVRRVAGALIIIFGVWTIIGANQHILGQTGQHHHSAPEATQEMHHSHNP